MAESDHWHPVLLSRELRHKPVGVQLNGQKVVLFRAGPGQVGALEDICPHRRMRLSMGKVVGGRLQCLYHGWTYDCSGNGESPATPKLYACANRLEAVERHGAVWVKSADSQPAFPQFDVAGYYNICNLRHVVQAPLETTLDNFTEIEHTPTTHAFFGYPLERMHEVRVEFQTTDASVRVINHGPSKKISLPLKLLLGVRRRHEFCDDWMTYFSPVYSVYDHWWADPAGMSEALARWRLYIFFTPADAESTVLTTFAFMRHRYPCPQHWAKVFGWLMRFMLDREIRLDVRILENLADKSPRVEGMKLSRFDKVLGLNRERIDRIYRARS
jgi:phenylpropionate dioxygenase-like ring-hydroxylating dioxygenase large terminal subunit